MVSVSLLFVCQLIFWISLPVCFTNFSRGFLVALWSKMDAEPVDITLMIQVAGIKGRGWTKEAFPEAPPNDFFYVLGHLCLQGGWEMRSFSWPRCLVFSYQGRREGWIIG